MIDWIFVTASSKELAVLGICLLIGAILIYKYCLDRFDKPVDNLDDRWNFLVPSQLTPHRQYILGFTIYFGLSLLLFLFFSLAGPDIVIPIVGKIAGSASPDHLFSGLKDRSTFPIIVAFLMIGVYPNLRLPPEYDVEIWLRRIGHWISYIPKNMIGLVEQMEFAEFDVPSDTVTNAWSLIGLKRPTLEAQDLKHLGALLDRLVVLYVRAAAPAGDLESDDIAVLRKDIGLDVFRQYRAKLTDVQSTIESVHARLGLEELGRIGGADRRRTIRIAYRDIKKSLDFLYVIFASAISAKGSNRLEDQMRAIGFTSQFHPKQQIPWSPILRVVGFSAIVLLIGLTAISNFFLKWFVSLSEYNQSLPFPTTGGDIIRQVVLILITLSIAIGTAVSIRTVLIHQDTYFSDKPAAYVKIAIKCFFYTLPIYLIAYIDQVLRSGEYLEYVWFWLKWPIVPASCGVLVAISLDRPANSSYERAISGVIVGGGLAFAAWFVVVFNANFNADLANQIYTVIVYSGFGSAIGAVLPAAIRAYRETQQNHMPQLVATLYNEVRQHFYDDGQFKEWLHIPHPQLGGRPPRDLLHEDGGMERIIAFVSETRKAIAPSM